MDSEPDINESAKLIETIQASGLVTGTVILVVTWFAVRLVTATFERAGNRFVHRRLVLNQVSTLLRFLIYIGGLAAAVSVSINLSRELMLAMAGTVAVTIGFALKDLASSILAGVTLLIDRPFQVGDRIDFDKFNGEILSMGLRSVRLMTSDSRVVTIPNNKFLTEAVASANHGQLEMTVSLEFFVSASQDISAAKRIIEECMTSNRYIFLGKPWIVLASQILCDSGSAVKLVARAHVLDMNYDDLYATTVTERVLQAFRAKGIALPGETPAPPREQLAAA